MEGEQGIWTIDEVSKYLRVSRWTIYRLIKKKEIPFLRVGKTSIRFQKEKIDSWLTWGK